MRLIRSYLNPMNLDQANSEYFFDRLYSSSFSSSCPQSPLSVSQKATINESLTGRELLQVEASSHSGNLIMGYATLYQNFKTPFHL